MDLLKEDDEKVTLTCPVDELEKLGPPTRRQRKR
jgi:hypothetical protein